jgi:CopG antitoxin of type II toxin-antitoxin system
VETIPCEFVYRPNWDNSVYNCDLGVYDHFVATHVRKNITLPRSLDERIRKTARKRGTTQSGLIVHLVEKGLAAEASQVDRVLAFAGVLNGPPDLSETIDETVYRP